MLQKSGRRPIDEDECQYETDDDRPGTDNDRPGTTTGLFRTTGAAAQPVVDIAAEALNLPAGSSCRQSKTPTPPRDHSALLASLCCACCSALGDCFIFLYVRPPSLATHFRYSALVPHRLLHTSRPVSTINRVTVISFVRAVHY